MISNIYNKVSDSEIIHIFHIETIFSYHPTHNTYENADAGYSIQLVLRLPH